MTSLSSGASGDRLQRAARRQPERGGQRVGDAGVGGVGVGVRGEQRRTGADQPVHQRALRGVRADPVHPAQQQRVVRHQQLRTEVEGLVDGLRDRVDGDQHARHLVGRVAADQPDGVPALRESRRVRRLQRGDGVGQPGRHARDLGQRGGQAADQLLDLRGGPDGDPDVVGRQARERVAAPHRHAAGPQRGADPLALPGRQPQQQVGRDAGEHGHAGDGPQCRGLRGPAAHQRVGRAGGRRDRLRCAAGGDGLQREGRDRPRRPGAGEPGEQGGVAEGVAGPQPGQRPGLGEAAEHEQAGHVRGGQRLRLAGQGVGERLVDEDDAPRPGQRGDRAGGVQDAGRVGGVADHDEVRVVGDVAGVQAVAVGLVGEDADDGHAPGAQRGLGLGEPGVHDGRQPRVQRREEREALRAAGQHEHLVGPAAVPGGDGVPGAGVGGGRRVAGETVQGWRRAGRAASAAGRRPAR